MLGSAGTETSTQISSGIKAGSLKDTSKLEFAPRQKLELPVGIKEGDGMSPQSDKLPVAQFCPCNCRAIRLINKMRPKRWALMNFSIPVGIRVNLQNGWPI